MALRDMSRLVYAYLSVRPGRSARSHLGNQVRGCDLARLESNVLYSSYVSIPMY